MRTLLLVIILLIPLTPSLAQDPGRPAPNAPQPAQPQAGSTPATTAQSKSGQSDRVLDRMGPGIDWDHRKAGRDWKIVPDQHNGEAGRN